MSPLRLMIVDDHRVMREGLRMALEVDKDLKVVAEAADGKEAVAKATLMRPDVILMDVMMPGSSGIDACHEIKGLLPQTAILMLTASADAESVTASLVAGAQGYVLKVAGREELVRAIRAVAAGESILDPAVTRLVTDRFRHMVERERQHEVDPLSAREQQVLLLVARGATNKEIAEQLIISEFTARNMVSNILGKLGLRNRSELVRWAFQHGVGDGAGPGKNPGS